MKQMEEEIEDMKFFSKLMEVFIEEKGMADEFLEFAENEIKKLTT
jgi:hypothetical protein